LAAGKSGKKPAKTGALSRAMQKAAEKHMPVEVKACSKFFLAGRKACTILPELFGTIPVRGKKHQV
jgi:hypothetical protein